MNSVDIICPLYNAEKYIKNLNQSLLSQKNVNINKIIYILTESTDKSEKILKDEKIDYKKIKKQDFSHSLTRENFARKSNADIICFISQDIIINSNNWLEELIKPIIENKVAAAFSRQISLTNDIEKYIREYNYVDFSYIKQKSDIEKFGLKTFFFSDASSAIKNSVFKNLNYYDKENLPTNEDMYIAYKLIMKGYKIAYCSNSIVIHSHDLNLNGIYNKYKIIGQFFNKYKYLDNYKTNKSGFQLSRYVLKQIIKDRKIKLLLIFPFNMAARFIGLKVGKVVGEKK